MRTSQSTYSVSLAGLSLAKVDAALAALPATGHIDQINWPKDYPAAPETTFTLAHTDEMLFVRFEVKGEVPLATKTNDLEHVNEDACVEIFIANADNTRYWNFEFNAAGVCNASSRKSRKEDVIRLNAEQLQSIQRYAQSPIANRKSLPIEGEAEGASWSLLVGIPFSLIELDLSRERARRANLYKCGDKTPNKHYASWNPIESPTPAFHLPEFFGEIQLLTPDSRIPTQKS